MRILHISAECYPAAKVGGLGDVVGALPKYLCQAGIAAGVIIPKYPTPWISAQRFAILHNGLIRLPQGYLTFKVEQLTSDGPGFPLFVVSTGELFDKPGVYVDSESGQLHGDETERRIYFQRAVLQWLRELPELPEVLHCHDHHTALIPFLLKQAFQFKKLRNIPTVLTIHNGVYQGAFSRALRKLLPDFAPPEAGLLEWEGQINPLAAGIRYSDRLTTVSPGYLEELQQGHYGLGSLYQSAASRSAGILNGIDTQTWDPATDSHMHQQLDGDIATFKTANKHSICERFGFDPALPLVTFIGRLVGEKGADLLPEFISRYLYESQNMNFVVLGTGQPDLEDLFRRMSGLFAGHFEAVLKYDEGLAHQLYAASDFLLMPSRTEPCGLNQLYALRYGTIPIVRSTGGLKDTIPDIGEPGGRGIRFDRLLSVDAVGALRLASRLYEQPAAISDLRNHIMQLDFSWSKSVGHYINLYQSLHK